MDLVYVPTWMSHVELLWEEPAVARFFERLRRWFGRLERFSSSPGTVQLLSGLIGNTDVRAVLPTIQVPTLVVYRRDDPLIDPRHSKYLAERIPGAKLVELPPGDTLPVF